MKSLEIVNKLLKNNKNQLDFYLDNGVPISKLKDMTKYSEQLETIKQDLEVLEIIRKKIVDVKLLSMFFVALMTDEEILFSYNSSCRYDDEKLTMEELLKLKQWLEGNE